MAHGFLSISDGASNLALSRDARVVKLPDAKLHFVLSRARFTIADPDGSIERLIAPLTVPGALLPTDRAIDDKARSIIATLCARAVLVDAAVAETDPALARGMWDVATLTHHQQFTVGLIGQGEVADALSPLLADLPLAVVPLAQHGDAPLPRVDLVVVAADYEDFTFMRAQNRALLRADLPTLYGYVDRQIVRIGPYVVPGVTPCVECYYHRVAASRQNPASFDAQQEAGTILAQPQAGRVAAAWAGATLATQVLQILHGTGVHSWGSEMHEYSASDGSYRLTRLLRLPACHECADHNHPDLRAAAHHDHPARELA